jgi:hypothetical protein
MVVARSVATALVVVAALIMLAGSATAEEPAGRTAQELAAPIPATDAGSKLAGGVSLAGLGGLIVFGLRRRVRASASA